MKLLTALICIVLYANSVSANGIRVKRGLSADEKEKLLTELNKDRKQIAKDLELAYYPVIYNENLVERIVESPKDCSSALHGRIAIPLKGNTVANDINEHSKTTDEGDLYYQIFHPSHTNIGCSKTFKCSEELKAESPAFDVPPKLVGKTMEYYGMCVMRDSPGEIDPAVTKKLKKAKLPSLSKYGDILGVVGPSGSSGRASGIVYPIVLSLVLVFFI